MAVPFPRSTRALRADGFRYALLGLAVGLLLLALWLSWFFGAEVRSWESSSDAKLTGRYIEAGFSAAQLRRISRGQPARFYPDADQLRGLLPATARAAQAAAQLDHGLAAVVRRVAPGNGNGNIGADPGRVELVLVPSGERPTLPTAPLDGRVTIEVARYSPAQLVLRGAGLGQAAR